MKPRIVRPMMLFWDGCMWRCAYPDERGRLVSREPDGTVRLDLKIEDARMMAALDPHGYRLWE